VHLLYLIDSLVPAGAEQSLATLAPAYIRAGITLDAAYLDDRPGLQDALEAAGTRLFDVSGPGGRLASVRRVVHLLSERRPDLLHTTLFEADVTGRIAASLTRTPVVSSIVNLAYGPEQRRDPALRTWKVTAAQAIDTVTARTVVRFHALSQHLAEVMGPRLRISPRRIDVIPRGRDPDWLGTRTPARRSRAAASIGVAPESGLVLAVSRQEFQKGLDVLLEAFRVVVGRVSAVHLVVAGREGNQTSALRATMRRLGLEDSVRFLGARDDVPELLCAADVFCLPSRWEGLGSVLLEAMALEAPIVASDLPAVREVLGEGAATIVPVGSADALARAILEALDQRTVAAERARRARQRFLAHFTTERVASRMISFYQRALARRNARPTLER
jgi:glycosyltransferase involved in cell wall biosynthesis